MSKIEECIKAKDWGELALITNQAIHNKKLEEQKKNKDEQIMCYEIDKFRRVRKRTR